MHFKLQLRPNEVILMDSIANYSSHKSLNMILLAAFGAVAEPLASCMIVHFLAHI